ncbi:MAG TPA: hypothetical protein VF710_26740 [Longimicrobium sp.]|jgi:hypothetical protein
MHTPRIHLAALAALLLAPPAASAQARASVAALDTAIARMGGAERLAAVQRVRLEMVTQWQRTTFGEGPYGDAPSYELNTDLRDYTRAAWRNTRRSYGGGAWREIVDVVLDSVAIRHLPAGFPSPSAPGGWAPLNVAYVDERRELFAFAPERLLLALRGAPDLRALRDTVAAGVRYARVAGTVDRFRATLLVRRGDGFPASVHFAEGAPNDFGLVPWGRMEVAIHYSAWRPQEGLVYPFQWDVARVGRPYKRMSILAARFNPEASPDSFAVSDSLRAAYLATARRPMHDLPLASAKRVGTRFASFATFGAPAGAVKVGGQWLLLEAGQAPLSAERATQWLAGADPGSRMGGAILTLAAPGNGGVAHLARERIPVYLAPGALPFVAAMLRGHGVASAPPAPVRSARWLTLAGDSVWMEPIDLPDAPGAMLVYLPSLEWVYSGTMSNPIHRGLVLARVCGRGWAVTRAGTPSPAFDAPTRGSLCSAP